MREILSTWISAADAIRQFEHFKIPQQLLELSYVRTRSDDYYISLVGELFDKMRVGFDDPKDWAKLGNAISQLAPRDGERPIQPDGISHMQVFLYAAASFYFGGFPASAYLTLKQRDFEMPSEPWAACFDLLSRPIKFRSRTCASLLEGLSAGRMDMLAALTRDVKAAELKALQIGPQDWIPLRLLGALLDRFNKTNLRVVLPEGGTAF